ncbi:MAG: CocE/NonD family hydrolase [Solirubrobacterales bacterium]|nr:CocE/NonD family hydrolase [Solirubrobacterales bacterium]
MPAGLVVERDVRVPMRDGIALAADVWRPADGVPVPALLQRTPYNKDMAASPEVFRMANAGYAVVVQDTRGRYASEGTFAPFVHEADDGEDTIAWVAARAWCDGGVGGFGSSYVGATQWLAAARAPAALRAMAPNITAADYHEGWTYQGGALQLGFSLTWALMFLGLGEVARRLGAREATAGDVGAAIAAADRLHDLFPHAPLAGMPGVEGVAEYWREWLEHPSYDEHWRPLAPRERYEDVVAPALNIGGWYDLFLAGTLQNYRGMRERGGSDAARRPRLLIGPWAHANVTGDFPERAFGLAGGALLADVTGRQLRWFDHHLKGADNGVADELPVRLFVLGIDAWTDEADWPPPDAREWRLHLGAGGALTETPPGDEPEDVFAYDPADPAPTVGGATFLPGLLVGANAGPRDQRAIEERDDVLCYTTTPLEYPLTVIGDVVLVLHAASSARDTDFTAKLVDVHPDGRAEIVCDGILRARYRDSLAAPAPLEPDRAYALHIEVGATAIVFRAGHRIRLEVSSSNFPRFDRNTNTGGVIAHDGPDDFVVARNRVFHDERRPSHLVLPVVDREWPQ